MVTASLAKKDRLKPVISNVIPRWHEFETLRLQKKQCQLGLLLGPQEIINIVDGIWSVVIAFEFCGKRCVS